MFSYDRPSLIIVQAAYSFFTEARASIISSRIVTNSLIGGLSVTGLTADHRLNGSRRTTLISGRLQQLSVSLTINVMDRHAWLQCRQSTATVNIRTTPILRPQFPCLLRDVMFVCSHRKQLTLSSSCVSLAAILIIKLTHRYHAFHLLQKPTNASHHSFVYFHLSLIFINLFSCIITIHCFDAVDSAYKFLLY